MQKGETTHLLNSTSTDTKNAASTAAKIKKNEGVKPIDKATDSPVASACPGFSGTLEVAVMSILTCFDHNWVSLLV